MSTKRYTFDTNILFYSLDPDAGTKHRTASHLVGTADTDRALLMLQSLGELCSSVRRKRPDLAAVADTFVLRKTVLFDVAHAIPSDLNDAIFVSRENKISFWDALLWATARRNGCTLF